MLSCICLWLLIFVVVVVVVVVVVIIIIIIIVAILSVLFAICLLIFVVDFVVNFDGFVFYEFCLLPTCETKTKCMYCKSNSLCVKRYPRQRHVAEQYPTVTAI